jgi:hypothetical protein
VLVAAAALVAVTSFIHTPSDFVVSFSLFLVLRSLFGPILFSERAMACPSRDQESIEVPRSEVPRRQAAPVEATPLGGVPPPETSPREVVPAPLEPLGYGDRLGFEEEETTVRVLIVDNCHCRFSKRRWG